MNPILAASASALGPAFTHGAPVARAHGYHAEARLEFRQNGRNESRGYGRPVYAQPVYAQPVYVHCFDREAPLFQRLERSPGDRMPLTTHRGARW